MKYYLKIFLLFFSNLIAWNICLFIASMIFQTDQPATAPLITSSIFMFFFSYLISIIWTKLFKLEKVNRGYLSISTMVFVLLLILLITIPNGTTQIFFGNIASYVTFIATGIGTYLGLKKVLPSS